MNEYHLELINGQKAYFKLEASNRLFALLRDPNTQLVWNHDRTQYYLKHAIMGFRILNEVKKEE